MKKRMRISCWVVEKSRKIPANNREKIAVKVKWRLVFMRFLRRLTAKIDFGEHATLFFHHKQQHEAYTTFTREGKSQRLVKEKPTTRRWWTALCTQFTFFTLVFALYSSHAHSSIRIHHHERKMLRWTLKKCLRAQKMKLCSLLVWLCSDCWMRDDDKDAKFTMIFQLFWNMLTTTGKILWSQDDTRVHLVPWSVTSFFTTEILHCHSQWEVFSIFHRVSCMYFVRFAYFSYALRVMRLLQNISWILTVDLLTPESLVSKWNHRKSRQLVSYFMTSKVEENRLVDRSKRCCNLQNGVHNGRNRMMSMVQHNSRVSENNKRRRQNHINYQCDGEHSRHFELLDHAAEISYREDYNNCSRCDTWQNKLDQ